MILWKNLDTLQAYSKLLSLKGHVNLAEAMSGESGKERVAKYAVRMGGGLTYNYAAKAVDDEVLTEIGLTNFFVCLIKEDEFIHCLISFLYLFCLLIPTINTHRYFIYLYLCVFI